MITRDEIQELLRMFSSEDDVTSLSQALSQVLSPVLSPVCPQLSEVQLKKIVSVIDYLFRASGSITELMDCAGEKNKSRFRQTILKPLVDIGLVEPTIKDVPNSPKQKYALTDNGREKCLTRNPVDTIVNKK